MQKDFAVKRFGKKNFKQICHIILTNKNVHKIILLLLLSIMLITALIFYIYKNIYSNSSVKANIQTKIESKTKEVVETKYDFYNMLPKMKVIIDNHQNETISSKKENNKISKQLNDNKFNNIITNNLYTVRLNNIYNKNEIEAIKAKLLLSGLEFNVIAIAADKSAQSTYFIQSKNVTLSQAKSIINELTIMHYSAKLMRSN